ncbi:MAG TPA: hypothetical protein VFI02_09100, partial [Armatimonadota bacterium]|nr:hypothetical protein [Armatimonadota bacterium]
SISSGEFYDEDLEHDTLAHASTDTWECYYVDGSGNVRWVDCEATFPVYAIGGVIAYNNAGTLTPVANNKYICYHVFSTNIKTDAGADYYPVVTPGIAEYGSKADAQDAALSEIASIDLGGWPKEEVIPIATVIYKHLSSMGNGVEAATQSTLGGGNFIDWRFTSVSGSSTSVNDHGALSGLTDDDHPLYVLVDGTRAMTGDLYLSASGGAIYIEDSLAVDQVAVEIPGGGPQLNFGNTNIDSYYFTNVEHHFDKQVTLEGGNLYIDKTSDPTIFLREGGDTSNYSALINPDDAQLQIQHTRASGDSFIALDPIVGSGTDDAEVRLFRTTNTNNTVDLVLYQGDGTATVAHSFRADSGDIDLCQQGGSVTVYGTISGEEKITVTAANSDDGFIAQRFETSAGAATNLMRKARGTEGSETVVVDADRVGTFLFQGHDGTGYIDLAQIQARVDGTPGTNDMPGRLSFFTTSDGAAVSAERMRLGSDGGMIMYGGYIQLPYLGAAPASPANGMIWMESDGLHIYYAGAEKTVAGV